MPPYLNWSPSPTDSVPTVRQRNFLLMHGYSDCEICKMTRLQAWNIIRRIKEKQQGKQQPDAE